jgi:hypothetical protein
MIGALVARWPIRLQSRIARKSHIANAHKRIRRHAWIIRRAIRASENVERVK